MKFPDEIADEDIKIHCQEWEIAGYTPLMAAAEDHPLRPTLLHIFEPLDESKHPVPKGPILSFQPVPKPSYYWLVEEYLPAWREGKKRVWLRRTDITADRIMNSVQLGLD